MIEVGKKYGMLLCLGKDTSKDSRYYIFRCDCGNVKSIIYYNVQRGVTTSCGCRLSKMLKNGEMHKIHGGRGTRLYKIWKSMRERCNNPNSNRRSVYFDRGISICSEWNDFSAFRNWALNNGYSDSLTIDRINNDKGYSPENCRWSTVKEQANNRTNNRIIEYKGIKHTLSEWADFVGISSATIWARLNRGWNVEESLFSQVPFK